MEEEVKIKMADANRMVDESMLLAVKNQQEKRSLQEQVSQDAIDKLHEQHLCGWIFAITAHAHAGCVGVPCMN
jgi:hypothetical protein